MTIRLREKILNFSEQKKVLIFDEKGRKLSQTDTVGTELIQASDNVQQKLWKALWRAASHQQEVCKDGQNVEESPGTEESQLEKENVNEENKSKGGYDHLLILAHSSELMSESDSLDYTNGDDRNYEESLSHATVTDHESPGKQIERVRSDEVVFHGERTPRLSQIRRQARSQCNILVQQRLGESKVEHLQGRRIRLTQIRQQARSKNRSPLQLSTQKPSCGDSQRRIVRLSEFRRQARSRSNSLVQEVIEDHVHWHSNFQTSKDDQRQRIMADIFGEEDGFGIDCHQPEADSLHEYNVNGRMKESVPGLEVQDEVILGCEACLGNAGILDGGLGSNTTEKASSQSHCRMLQTQPMENEAKNGNIFNSH